MEIIETPIAISYTNGLVELYIGSTEPGRHTLRLEPETARIIARRLRHCAGEARRAGTGAAAPHTFRFEVVASPDDMVLLQFRSTEVLATPVFMTPDDAEECAGAMLEASEAARIRRIQKETN